MLSLLNCYQVLFRIHFIDMSSFFLYKINIIGHDNNIIINYIEDKWTSPSDIILEDQEDQDPGIRYLYSVRG